MARSFLSFHYLTFFFDTLDYRVCNNQLHTFTLSEVYKLSSPYLNELRHNSVHLSL